MPKWVHKVWDKILVEKSTRCISLARYMAKQKTGIYREQSSFYLDIKPPIEVCGHKEQAGLYVDIKTPIQG